MKSRALAWATLLLTAGNLLAGIFHYVYQLLAARSLSVVELGELNSVLSAWTWVAVGAVAFQMRLVMRGAPIGTQWINRLQGGAIAGVALSLIARPNSPWLEMFWSVPALFAFHGLMGLFQSSLRFNPLVMATFVFAFVKFISAWVTGAHEVTRFAETVGFGISAGVLAALVAWRFRKKVTFVGGASQKTSANPFGRSLVWAILPAASQLVMPANDLLAIRFFLGAEKAGLLSQAQLFSKILFFGPMAFLQISMAVWSRHRAEFMAEKISPQSVESPDLKRLRVIRRFLIVALCAGALTFALWPEWVTLLPWIGTMRVPYPDRWVVGLSCLAMIPLFGFLEAVQRASLFSEKRGIYLLVLAVGMPWAGAMLLKNEGLVPIILFNGVVWSGLSVAFGRRGR